MEKVLSDCFLGAFLPLRLQRTYIKEPFGVKEGFFVDFSAENCYTWNKLGTGGAV